MINTNLFTAQILILIYIIITFGYSAIEKLLQWEKNIDFYENHFKETSLKNTISFLLKVVILLEIITVIICIIGLLYLIIFFDKEIGFYGLVLAAITLIGLMFGQRIAKDYVGAAYITIYFILTIVGIFLLQ
ncbi:MAG: DoxX family protein [Flavobacteriaceae bacterium]|nr:DoxX family protein [Flavobacteriaceae bacterium]